MKDFRHGLFRILLGLAGLGLLAGAPASAQSWPERPIKALVAFSPGGVVDVMARAVLTELGHELGQPIVVENRQGAGGSIAVSAALSEPANGYTLLVTSNFLLVNPVLDSSVKWTSDEFVPVGRYALSPSYLLAPLNAPYSTVAEFVEYAKQHPKLPFPDGGAGTTQTMGSQMLFHQAGIEMESIYYKGAPPMVPDMVNGQLAVGAIPSTVAIPLVQSGRLKALAITSDKRSTALPDVPTLAESGYPDATAVSWYGLHVRKGTPQSIIDRLAAALQKACASESVRTALASAGGEEAYQDTPTFAAYVQAESDRWLGLLKSQETAK